MIEEWRKVPSLHQAYEVSSLGRIRSTLKRGVGGLREESRVLATPIGSNGFVVLRLKQKDGTLKTTQLAKVVAEAFLGPKPEGLRIIRKNGVSNDLRVENLEYR